MRKAASSALWTAIALSLIGSPAAADYDWYDEEEGSTSSSDDGDRGDDGAASDSDDSDDGADDPGRHRGPRPGWGLGLRVSYALPFGDLAEDAPLDELMKGVVKPQLDLSYGIDEHLAIAAYLALGAGIKPPDLKRACDVDGVDCRLLALESGLLAEYRILPRALVDPWVAANLGLEWISQTVKAAGAEFSQSALGVGFGASAGADFELGGWAIGPFLGVQIGRFMRSKFDLNGSIFDDEDAGGDGKIEQRAYHYWLNVGLRVRYP